MYEHLPNAREKAFASKIQENTEKKQEMNLIISPWTSQKCNNFLNNFLLADAEGDNPDTVSVKRAYFWMHKICSVVISGLLRSYKHIAKTCLGKPVSGTLVQKTACGQSKKNWMQGQCLVFQRPELSVLTPLRSKMLSPCISRVVGESQ